MGELVSIRLPQVSQEGRGRGRAGRKHESPEDGRQSGPLEITTAGLTLYRCDPVQLEQHCEEKETQICLISIPRSCN